MSAVVRALAINFVTFARHIGAGVRMKAAGGIRSLKDAEDYIALGCERLGTSAIVKLVKKERGI